MSLERAKALLKELFWHVLVIALIIWGCVEVFGPMVWAVLSKMYADFKTGVWPMVPNIASAGLVLYFAYRFYGYLRRWVMDALTQSGHDDDTKSMVGQTFQVIYWGGTLVFAALMIWSDFLAKLTIGITPVLVAIWASCGDQIKALVSGWAIRLMGHIKIGDVVTFVATPAITGKLISKGKASITLEKTEEIEKDTPQGRAKVQVVKHLIVPNLKVVTDVISVDVSETVLEYLPATPAAAGTTASTTPAADPATPVAAPATAAAPTAGSSPNGGTDGSPELRASC